MAQENRLYLLIHTMTVADNDFVIQAQFFHTFFDGLMQLANARLIGQRVNIRLHPGLRRDRSKAALQRLQSPSLKNLMKRNSAVVKHHLRAVHIGPEFQKANPNIQNTDTCLNHQTLVPQKALNSNPQSPEKKDDSSNSDNGIPDSFNNNQLTQFSSPDETVHWLTANRFEKYLDVFSRFSGSDMLRMSRDDFIQICGQADGIRLHNALHLKAIAPKLKLYVCRENTSVFNAIFLSSHSYIELVQKLCSLANISPDQVKAIYIEGPHSIHIQLSDDVLRHVEEETMFSLNVMQENGGYILLLRRKAKQ